MTRQLVIWDTVVVVLPTIYGLDLLLQQFLFHAMVVIDSLSRFLSQIRQELLHKANKYR